MATYLNKIKILDGENQTSSTTPFNFGIGTLREEGGNIVYDGDDGKQKILLAKGTTEGTYTLEGTVLQAYMDQRDTFLKKVEYIDGNIRFTFQLSNEDADDIYNEDADTENVQIIDVPVKDFAIDADNIYFVSKETTVKLTETFGQYKPDSVKGYVEVPLTKTVGRETKPKSLQEVFIDAYQVKKDPNVTPPTYSLNVNPYTNKNYEIGSKITQIQWDGTFTDGSYDFGEGTNKILAGLTTSYAYALKIGNQESFSNTGVTSLDKAPYSLAEGQQFTVAEEGSATYGVLQGVCSYSGGITPNNNLGEAAGNQIASNTITQTININVTGYRNFWYGFVTELKDTGNSISRDSSTGVVTFNNIQLTAGNKAVSKGYLPNCEANKGIQEQTNQSSVAFVILTPNNKNKAISNMVSLGALNTTIPATEYKKKSKFVTINGANGYTAIDYDLLYYKPAEIPNGMTLTVELT